MTGSTTLHVLRVFVGRDGAELGVSETVFVDDAATGALRILTPS